MPELEAELRDLLAKTAKTNLAGVGLDDDLVVALGLDSLAALRMLAAVEKRFNVRFPDERLSEFRTLRAILAAISECPSSDGSIAL
jgi:acyl carrier protein